MGRKQDISFEFSLSDIPGLIVEPNNVTIEKLAEGGSYGENISLNITNDASPGIHFLNIKYSQILVSNNETPQDPFYHDIAIPITIKEDPNVTIHTKTPESIFANAEFPIEVEVIFKILTLLMLESKSFHQKILSLEEKQCIHFLKLNKILQLESHHESLLQLKK